MKEYLVALQDKSVGIIKADIDPRQAMLEGDYALIGRVVVIQLKDENGKSIEKEGIIAEVLS